MERLLVIKLCLQQLHNIFQQFFSYTWLVVSRVLLSEAKLQGTSLYMYLGSNSEQSLRAKITKVELLSPKEWIFLCQTLTNCFPANLYQFILPLAMQELTCFIIFSPTFTHYVLGKKITVFKIVIVSGYWNKFKQCQVSTVKLKSENTEQLCSVFAFSILCVCFYGDLSCSKSRIEQMYHNLLTTPQLVNI